ncbi:YceD family protein [Caldimonas brevitalea]|uniref:Large ribosomal RNA subunit accumulation protein YceD n=1 Tax=Caldimonas brevitalea TaxID=413882 RepID=A0A0G3BP37_9BURK|nr:DUF177 domain-containing protein [Caldimonas brevitalea]AKJ31172.1 hypothetical protein AAW51_4481 [Caldimonas brevitalea]
MSFTGKALQARRYTRQMKAKEFNPQRLDVREFIQAQVAVRGEWPLAALPRLAQEAHADAQAGDQPVQWAARGWQVEKRGAAAELWMHVSASTVLGLECQRCLQPVETALEVERDFRFVADEATAAQIDADSEEDVLALSRSLNLQELVEDELILALPLVPRHDACAPPAQLAGAEVGEADVPGEPERPNPFAVLAQLKKPTSSS